MTFIPQNNPLTGKPYGMFTPSLQVDKIAELKAKYPLAVDTLKCLGDNLHYDKLSGYVMTENGIVVEVLEIRGWGQIQYLDNPETRQDQIGEMLAEFLNSLKDK